MNSLDRNGVGVFTPACLSLGKSRFLFSLPVKVIGVGVIDKVLRSTSGEGVPLFSLCFWVIFTLLFSEGFGVWEITRTGDLMNFLKTRLLTISFWLNFCCNDILGNGWCEILGNLYVAFTIDLLKREFISVRMFSSISLLLSISTRNEFSVDSEKVLLRREILLVEQNFFFSRLRFKRNHLLDLFLFWIIRNYNNPIILYLILSMLLIVYSLSLHLYIFVKYPSLALLNIALLDMKLSYIWTPRKRYQDEWDPRLESAQSQQNEWLISGSVHATQPV